MSFQILRRLIEASDMRISESIMLVMAHPDDAVIWCGGLLAKYLTAGAKVHVVSVTGNQETEKELHTLRKYFPTVQTTCFGYDEFQGSSSELVDRVKAELVRTKPGLVVTHHMNDPHYDHRSTTEGVLGAFMKTGKVSLPQKVLMCSPYYHGTPNAPAFMPDIYLNISNEIEVKHLLIGEHVSQNPSYWIEMSQGMDGLAGSRAGVEYAEPYETMTYYGTPKAIERI